MTGGTEGARSWGSGVGFSEIVLGGGSGERGGGSGVGILGLGEGSEDCDGDLGVFGRLPNSRGIAMIQVRSRGEGVAKWG